MAATVMAAATLSGAYADSVSLGLQADAEKKQAEINNKIMNLKAKQAAENGEVGAAKLKAQANKMQGSQRAALAASGVVVDYGTAADIQDETSLFSSIDAEKIKNNAMLEALGYKMQGANILMQGEFNSMALNNKAQNSLLTGAIKAGAYGYQAYNGGTPKEEKFKVDEKSTGFLSEQAPRFNTNTYNV